MHKVKYTPISFSEFIKYIRNFKPVESSEDDLLYEAYNAAVELLEVHHDTFTTLPFENLDHIRLILYLIHDYEFRLKDATLDVRIKRMNNDQFFSKLISSVVDKYGSESYFKYEENRLISRFSSEISTINVYVNFISLKLNQLTGNDKGEKLYLDLLRNAFSLCRTINELLIAGFEKEALSTWRSLHELEAVLVLVANNDVLRAYSNHVIYNAALNGLLPSDKTDEIFLKIKDEMRSFNLKSKDTRRYIEYGWISSHPAFDVTIHKFNFRDGVQLLAGLSYARDAYKNASEAAHSSPLFLFMDPARLLEETLRNLYKSFLVIEGLFAANYKQNAPENEVVIYEQVRQLYLADINDVLTSLN